MNDGPVLVVGAGPAGLMAAEVISAAGYRVQVIEQKPSAARKLLMAGKSGLNITHSEPTASLIERYDKPEWLGPMIKQFDAKAIQAWMDGLGIASYVGSSGRVFPNEMKAAPLLRQWIARLKAQGVTFSYRTQWLGWDEKGHALLAAEGRAPESTPVAATVLAAGGGSWKRLGSDGQTVGWLSQQGIQTASFEPSNSGVQVVWSRFVKDHAGQPLKRIRAGVDLERSTYGDAVITESGLESGVVYPLSRALGQQLAREGKGVLWLDLLPDVSVQDLERRLRGHDSKKLAKQSQANRWRRAGLEGVKAALVRDYLPKPQWADARAVAQLAKALPLPIAALASLDEAISTAGGVSREALTTELMLNSAAGVFCCGEMLDWDAPTGGYLLTACLASGRWAGQGVVEWLRTAATQSAP